MADKKKRRNTTRSLSRNLGPPKGSRKKKVRVGRGMGSKLGRTAGAGNKGQKSRRGYCAAAVSKADRSVASPHSEARVSHPFGVSYSVVTSRNLTCSRGRNGYAGLLRAHGFIRRATDPIKVLGDGELKTKLTVHAHAFSATAKEKITKAGGTSRLVA